MARNRNAFAALLAGLALLSVVPRASYADGQISYGTQWWNQTAPEAKYQEFTEVPNGVYLESFALREMRNRNLLTFYGSGIQRSDQAVGGSWWNGARFRVDLNYRQIPHNLSSIARSPLSEVTRGTLVVPDSLQARNEANSAGYVARIKDLLRASPLFSLGFRTDITNARLRARPARGWQLDLVGSRRLRSGRKPYGGGFSPGNGIEIWEPIAQRMLDGEARATYTKNRATFMATGGISEFKNEVDALTFDNPARLTGQGRGRIDLYPDNRSVRGTLSAAYRLPKRTALNASVAVSRNTQDDPWLPFTVNPADPYSSLDSLPPAKSTHARVDVLTQDYRLTSHPVKDLGGTLRYRKYDYVNKTAEHEFFAESVADGATSPDTFTVSPFGYRHETYGIDVDFNPIKQITLYGTAERLNRTRTDREVASDKEDAYAAKVRFRPIDKITADARVRSSKRRAQTSDFSYEGIEQTALRRFDVADRDQVQAGGGVTFIPSEKFELAGTFGYLFEKYEGDLADSVRIGLRRNHQRNASVDGTYHATEDLDLMASLGWEQFVSRQSSRQSRTAAFGTKDSTWTARLKDEGLFGSAGLDWRAMPDRLGFTLGFDYSRFPSTFAFATVSPSTITALDPPSIKYRKLDFTFLTTYHLAKNTEVGLRYMWEQWDVVDFSAVDIPNLGIATGASSINFIYLGDSFQSYRANQVGLVVNQRF